MSSKIKTQDKCVRCRFFVVPADGLALLGMPDIELLSILRITFHIMGEPHEGRKFNVQTIEMSNNPSCRTSETL